MRDIEGWRGRSKIVCAKYFSWEFLFWLSERKIKVKLFKEVDIIFENGVDELEKNNSKENNGLIKDFPKNNAIYLTKIG